mmetsp:Transcript_34775/g.111094  ORF Transcript_34775/g.111094 Transcript_34775/m.111094 type:complete len:221 (-) Transcript_34775:19-681(-)
MRSPRWFSACPVESPSTCSSRDGARPFCSIAASRTAVPCFALWSECKSRSPSASETGPTCRPSGRRAVDQLVRAITSTDPLYCAPCFSEPVSDASAKPYLSADQRARRSCWSSTPSLSMPLFTSAWLISASSGGTSPVKSVYASATTAATFCSATLPTETIRRKISTISGSTGAPAFGASQRTRGGRLRSAAAARATAASMGSPAASPASASSAIDCVRP